jgi:hypothetical protein
MRGAGKIMDSDEFSTSPVPADRSIPWWKIALTNVLFSICLPTLITGLDLAIAAPQRRRSPVPGRTCVSGPRNLRPGGKSGSRDDDTV